MRRFTAPKFAFFWKKIVQFAPPAMTPLMGWQHQSCCRIDK